MIDSKTLNLRPLFLLALVAFGGWPMSFFENLLQMLVCYYALEAGASWTALPSRSLVTRINTEYPSGLLDH